MTGRIVSSALTCGLLTSLCACSPAEDVEALRPATEQADAEAQYRFALMYRNGDGVPQGETEAVRWYRLAADQGLAPAQHNLGLMYNLGCGVPQDEMEAVSHGSTGPGKGRQPGPGLRRGVMLMERGL